MFLCRVYVNLSPERQVMLMGEEMEVLVRPENVFEVVRPRSDQVRKTKHHAVLPSTMPQVLLVETGWPVQTLTLGAVLFSSAG